MALRKKADRAGKAPAVFGVGMQVVVRLDRNRYPDAAAEDPIGVIVAAGEVEGTALYAPVAGREAVWVVQFDEPFFGLDGSGPHASARVAQGSLEPAPEA
ncbi:hypothetical protein E3T26_13130 [Cryobacterium sp. TMT1-21]|uniref:Uncharacterized protein n=1 Tax=Cryobacterium shii TaxID=1259235 RepID=A0AAQ2HH68_9MICO|nr:MULTISPECIES: hypothetical protein [Cryobacterium]TFC52399.1 hypothetical protein E3O49_01745 [Cryobacterium shii]TFC87471.1 hypothetical protein E3T24_04575 [Cryobacterium sp. TmT2-59]TFD10835.1 hypothetical protein E3T26_13130 [Cryobacterium sp. TMT1-21]TFD16559.1 hypothetical protein E3T32_15360 [Cryobacterium sp. TMT2-23]TFD21908.1 hypothetical protein E3T42_00650 [Cryobacterium sp. TMT4-10]